MKMFSSFLLIAALLAPTAAKAAPVGYSDWEKEIYISSVPTSTQSALNTGRDYANAKGWYDGTLFTAPAGCIIEQAFAVVDVAVSGLTLVRVGDGSDAAGFFSSASSPLANTGLQLYDLTSRGAYLKLGGVAFAKYYAADTAILLDVTGTATAGKVKLVFRGYCI